MKGEQAAIQLRSLEFYNFSNGLMKEKSENSIEKAMHQVNVC